MLLEQYNKLTPERQLMLLDVGANLQLKQLLAAEKADVEQEIIGCSIDGMTKDEVYSYITPLKIRLDLLVDLQECLNAMLHRKKPEQ